MTSKAKKPDATPVSEGEKIQTQLARDQIDHYRSTYAPLEKRMVDEASQDYSDRLAGQATSGSMRQATGALRSAALGSGPVDTSALSGAISQAGAQARAEGIRMRDDQRLDALGVGVGITSDAVSSLSAAGRSQTQAAIDSTRQKIEDMQNKSMVGNALWASAGTLAGAYGTYKGLGKLGSSTAAKTSQSLGASQAGYGAGYLSGWKGVNQ